MWEGRGEMREGKVVGSLGEPGHGHDVHAHDGQVDMDCGTESVHGERTMRQAMP